MSVENGMVSSEMAAFQGLTAVFSFHRCMRAAVAIFVFIFLELDQASSVQGVETLRLHPDNPHYFLFRGKPTVLVGSSEHYAAVSNSAFDYKRYLDATRAANLNAVRLFLGTYTEPLDPSRHQTGNTLAPKPGDYLAPWPRSNQPGARDGLNKFDLRRWDPRFFNRLKDFVGQASRNGIIVEVTLFTPFYAQFSDYSWSVSPLNVANNVNGIGGVLGDKALSLDNGPLLAVQDALVRKVASELADFDNVYYEICNEPFRILGVPLYWQRHIADTLVAAEAALPARHLIAQELDPLESLHAQPKPQKLVSPIPQASIFVSHNLPEPQIVTINYALDKPLGYNENGFNGTADAAYRVQAWQYLMAGGAVAIGLDYSFTVGHEDGSFALPPGEIGGGSLRLRAQLGWLRAFVDQLDFIHMNLAPEIIRTRDPLSGSIYALGQPGKTYVLYISQGRQQKAKGMADAQYTVDAHPQSVRLGMELPAGAYSVSWIDPKTGAMKEQETLRANRSVQALVSPMYSQDIVCKIVAMGPYDVSSGK